MTLAVCRPLHRRLEFYNYSLFWKRRVAKLTITITIPRAALRWGLGLLVVVGLLHLLVILNLTERVDDNEIYHGVMEDNDIYDRIYEDVLLSEVFRDYTDQFFGNMEVDVYEEAVASLKDILPPEYLKSQTEGNADRFTSYLRGETPELKIYVELREPMERIPEIASREINRIVDAVVIPEATETVACTESAVRDLALSFVSVLQELRQNGRLPQSLPTLQTLDEQCLLTEFDRWYNFLINDPALPPALAAIISGTEDELRSGFAGGNTRTLLRVLAGPTILYTAELAVSALEGDIQAEGRLDLLWLIASQSEGTTKQDILDDAKFFKDIVAFSNGPAKIIALVMVFAGLVLLALTDFSNPRQAFRWVGVAIATGGVVCLVVGFTIHLMAPSEFTQVVGESISYEGGAPSPAVVVGRDLLRSIGSEISGGFILLSTLPLIVGVILTGASFIRDDRGRWIRRGRGG